MADDARSGLPSTRPVWPLPFAPAAMTVSPFDLASLYRAVDAKRADHRLSWVALSRQVGVAASTIRRYATADDAEADGVLALVRWLGVAPEDHLMGERTGGGDRLRPAGDGFVRVDMELLADASGVPLGGRGRTRTTIQRLVEAAQRSGRSIESLTRFSED